MTNTTTIPTYRGRTYEDIAGAIDHSLLRPELTLAEVEAGCAIAARYRTVSVCCRPVDVTFAHGLLTGTDVAIGTVVSFPHGNSTTAVKVAETAEAVANGATEIDVVLSIGLLRSGEFQRVQDDIAAVVAAADGHLVKVILENAYLSDAEKVSACHLVESAGADYVKTSTGFAPSGATLDDLRLMRASVGPQMKVKAAGGVRTLDAMIDVLDVGCSRNGTIATAVILDDFVARAR
ncbi:deoxyribose-phosphate aldolase [Demequina lutea]|uniref:Deoxyribose-phosphate aldolase n=1 Tax=Demequina lutea TaxID=431489 RepID=A0A7Y9Z941_9MICO|nr:deoxyribose-phosphate aldolase [Demequina lutea]NYI40520.1 deoxyribose-phosphate aldolase [Demequina lutea]